MKAKEIKDKKDSELTEQLKSKQQELRVVRFGSAGSKTRDVNGAKKLRRDIARILTEMNHRSVN